MSKKLAKTPQISSKRIIKQSPKASPLALQTSANPQSKQVKNRIRAQSKGAEIAEHSQSFMVNQPMIVDGYTSDSAYYNSG